MNELWTVEFSLMMQDIVGSSTPSVDGKMLVRGHDVFDVLEKANNRLGKFNYDSVIIHGAIRCISEKKGAKENE